jgi:hypothetical protein
MRCMGVRAQEKGFVLPTWSPVFLCFLSPVGCWFRKGGVSVDGRLYSTVSVDIRSLLLVVGCRVEVEFMSLGFSVPLPAEKVLLLHLLCCEGKHKASQKNSRTRYNRYSKTKISC